MACTTDWLLPCGVATYRVRPPRSKRPSGRLRPALPPAGRAMSDPNAGLPARSTSRSWTPIPGSPLGRAARVGAGAASSANRAASTIGMRTNAFTLGLLSLMSYLHLSYNGQPQTVPDLSLGIPRWYHAVATNGSRLDPTALVDDRIQAAWANGPLTLRVLKEALETSFGKEIGDEAFQQAAQSALDRGIIA